MKRKICIVAGARRGKSGFRTPAIILLGYCALLLFCGSSVAAGQDQQPAAPAAQDQQQAVSPAPVASSRQRDAAHAGSAFRGQGDHLPLPARERRRLRLS
jgi:hypothetical protein